MLMVFQLYFEGLVVSVVMIVYILIWVEIMNWMQINELNFSFKLILKSIPLSDDTKNGSLYWRHSMLMHLGNFLLSIPQHHNYDKYNCNPQLCHKTNNYAYHQTLSCSHFPKVLLWLFLFYKVGKKKRKIKGIFVFDSF